MNIPAPEDQTFSTSAGRTAAVRGALAWLVTLGLSVFPAAPASAVPADLATAASAADPLLRLGAKLLPRGVGSGAAGEFFGFACALDGITAAVAAPLAQNYPGPHGAVHVYVEHDGVWAVEATLRPPSGETSNLFGRSVALVGDTLAVGAPGWGDGSGDPGSVYLFRRSGTSWSLEAEMVPDGAAAGDLFGWALALTGDTLMVGAPSTDAEGHLNAGAAYVFVRGSTGWAQQARLVDPTGAAGDGYGTAVALRGDTAVVGVPSRATPAGPRAGAVHVFTRQAGNWAARALLVAPDGAPADEFGFALALDGDTLAVSGRYHDLPSRPDAGVVYVFSGAGAAWQLEAEFGAADAQVGDLFGFALALDGDGLLVGAALADTPEGPNAGAAYVFARSGTSWSQHARLTVADGPPGPLGDVLGHSVALSGRALVGAPFNDLDGLEHVGSAYVFALDAGQWGQQARLLSPRLATREGLGTALAVSGETLAASAPGVGGIGGRAVYVFVQGAGGWVEQARLTAPPSSAATYGDAIALDGDTLAVGAPRAWPNGGVVLVYTRAGGAWSLAATLTAAAGPYDSFGFALALDGDTLAVAAPGEASGRGAAYVYTRDAGGWSLQARLTASDAQDWDEFGHALALQGDVLALGAGSPQTGQRAAAYVFARSGSSWTEEARLAPSDLVVGSFFGTALALSLPLLAVGAPGHPSLPGPGHVYLFARDGAWTQQHKLTDPGSAKIGAALSLSGARLVAGAPYSMSATLFKQRGAVWQAAGSLRPRAPATDTRFGGSLASAGYRVMVGASRDDTDVGTDSGSVSVFEPFVKGDLDADLRTDVVLSRVSAAELQAWFMDGALRVGDPVPIEPAPASDQRVVGSDDFDGDLRNDLVLRDDVTGAVDFWLMDGAARVEVAPLEAAVPPPATWTLVATADFNRDSHPDLVWQDNLTRKLVIWLMRGTCYQSTRIPVPDSAEDGNWQVLAALDCDGNGSVDLLWYNTATGRLVQWLLDDFAQRLEGRFTNPPAPTHGNWRARAAGDWGAGLGAAGAPDVLWRNLDSGRFVLWHFDFAGNRSDGLFTTPMEPEGDPLDWTVVTPR